MTLSDALDDIWIIVQHLKVLLFSGKPDRCQNASLRCDVMILEQNPEVALEFRDRRAELFVGDHIDQEYFRILERVDEVFSRPTGQEAVQVRNPPPLEGELNDMFFAFLVDGVGTEAAARDERKIL